MLLGNMAKAKLAAFLAKALASYLIVDEKDIDTQQLLHGQNGRIRLQQVQLREQRIPVSSTYQGDSVITCYLVVSSSSTVEEFELQWTWSHHQGVLLDDLGVTLQGVQLQLSFQYEKGSEKDVMSTPPQGSEGDNDGESTSKSSDTKSNPFRRYFQEEMNRLKAAALSNIQQSDLLHQVKQNIMDSFDIKLLNVTINFIVPFQGGDTIQFGWKSFHFGTVRQEQVYTRRPGLYLIELSWEALYSHLKVHDEKEDSIPQQQRPRLRLRKQKKHHHQQQQQQQRGSVIPILEPFAYKTTSRRYMGNRFVDLWSGYELIGKAVDCNNDEGGDSSNEVDKDQQESSNKGGIIIHHSDEILKAHAAIQKALQGKAVGEPDYDAEIYKTKDEDDEGDITEPWPVSAKIILWMIFMIGTGSVSSMLWFILGFLGFLQHHREKLTLGIRVLNFVLFVSVTTFIMRLNLDNRDIRKRRKLRRLQGEKRLEDSPATFRIPIPYITVVAPDNVRMTITNFSLFGRMDCSKIVVSASGCTVRSRRHDFANKPAPKLLMSVIRASYHRNVLLINIDRVDKAFMPGHFSLEKPLVNSVVIFREGRLWVKLNTLRLRLLSADNESDGEEEVEEAEYSDNDFMNDVKKMVVETKGKIGATRKKMTEDIDKALAKLKLSKRRNVKTPDPNAISRDARNRMNAEIHEGLFHRRLLAGMFEGIPLAKHRERFRLYPNSFRGSEAVDFVLESQWAKHRLEAVKLLKELESDFTLFESVTRDYKFRDDYHSLYRFVDPSKRRFWTKADMAPYEYVETFERVPPDSPIPFPATITARNLTLGNDAKDPFLVAKKSEVYVEKGRLSRALDVTFLSCDLKSKFIAITNGRVHALYDPSVPKLVHRFQLTFDTLHVNPEYSIDDWLEVFGISSDDDEVEKSSKQLKEKDGPKSEPYSLPFAYVPEFLLRLDWEGVILRTQECTMKVKPFVGTESTSSNDLIREYVINVLGKTPGMLTRVRVMGVNVFESFGTATVFDIGSKFIPSGQWLNIGALVLYDSICSAIDAGKVARNDPTDSYRAGDFVRGVMHSAGDVARRGAQLRGKSEEDFYDDEDRIRLDPLDFGAGAAHGIYTYSNENKARFAGAFVATGVMIGTAVVFSPIAGIVAGVLVGGVTEIGVTKTEEYIFKRKADMHDDLDGGDDDYKDAHGNETYGRSNWAIG